MLEARKLPSIHEFLASAAEQACGNARGCFARYTFDRCKHRLDPLFRDIFFARHARSESAGVYPGERFRDDEIAVVVALGIYSHEFFRYNDRNSFADFRRTRTSRAKNFPVCRGRRSSQQLNQPLSCFYCTRIHSTSPLLCCR